MPAPYAQLAISRRELIGDGAGGGVALAGHHRVGLSRQGAVDHGALGRRETCQRDGRGGQANEQVVGPRKADQMVHVVQPVAESMPGFGYQNALGLACWLNQYAAPPVRAA